MKQIDLNAPEEEEEEEEQQQQQQDDEEENDNENEIDLNGGDVEESNNDGGNLVVGVSHYDYDDHDGINSRVRKKQRINAYSTIQTHSNTNQTHNTREYIVHDQKQKDINFGGYNKEKYDFSHTANGKNKYHVGGSTSSSTENRQFYMNPNATPTSISDAGYYDVVRRIEGKERTKASKYPNNKRKRGDYSESLTEIDKNWFSKKCTVREPSQYPFKSFKCLKFDEKRKLIYSVVQDTNIHIIDFDTLNTVKSFPTLHSNNINALAFNDDFLFTGGTDTLIHKISLNDFDKKAEVLDITGVSNIGKEGIYSMQLLDNHLFVGTEKGSVLKYDIAVGKKEMVCQAHKSKNADVACVYSMYINNDLCATSGGDYEVNLFDIKSGKTWKPVKSFSKHPKCQIPSIASCIQFDDKKLIAGYEDQKIKEWDLRDPSLEIRQMHKKSVTSLQFDSKKLVSSSIDKTVKIWKRGCGNYQQQFDFDAAVYSVVYNETDLIVGTGETIAVVNFDKKSV